MKTLVIIPTYLEAENIADAPGERCARPHAPTSWSSTTPAQTATADLAPPPPSWGVEVLASRQGRARGRLPAGFQHAFGLGYEVVVQMDADLSHPPDRLPALLAEVDKGADIAIGSRYVKGGATANWPLVRKVLSRSANIYASLMLGLGVATPPRGSGPTGPTSCLEVEASATKATGYGFQLELSYRAHRLGATIVEVPITFNDRVGVSKMSWHIIGEAMSPVAWWALRDRVLRRSGLSPSAWPDGGLAASAWRTTFLAAVASAGVADDPAAREPDVEAAAN